MLTTYLTVALVAYLLGSIPFGYILVKIFLKQDIRTTGSGNIGATNVARSGKKGLAIATLLLDAGKGVAAVALGSSLYLRLVPEWSASEGPPITWMTQCTALAAFCAIVGHMYPVWLGFKGGKGVATGVGAFFAFNSAATGLAFISFVLAFAITRIVSLSSIIASLMFIVGITAVRWWGYTWITIALCCASSLLIILKHHSNIRRLFNGTEPKFGVKKSVPADPIQLEKNA